MAKQRIDQDTDVDVDDTLDADTIEAQRISEIRAAFRRHEGVEVVQPEGYNKPIKASTFRTNAIRKGLSANEVELALFQASFPGEGNDGPAIQVRSPMLNGSNVAIEAIGAAVARDIFSMPSSVKCSHNGADYGRDALFSEQALEAADRRELRGVGLHQLMDMTIRAHSGVGYEGNRKSDAFTKAYVNAAKHLEWDGGGRIEAAGAGPFSTLTVGSILENVANKQLLSRFALTGPVWPQFCEQKTLNDFKPHALYRLDENLGYLEVGASGELKHGRLDDTKRTIQASTHGRMIALSRQDRINDDLDAFRQIINGLADGAVWALDSAVFFELLANAGSFFSVPNGNLITDVLGLAGLEAAENAFDSQVGSGGKPISATPAVLLVGSRLHPLGRNLFVQTNLLASGGNTNQVFQENRFQGLYSPVKAKYLSIAGIRRPGGEALAGQSDTLWFLLSRPTEGSVITVGLLEGKATPTIESAETSFDTLGMQWRGFHDFGVAQGDKQFGVMSSGTG